MTATDTPAVSRDTEDAQAGVGRKRLLVVVLVVALLLGAGYWFVLRPDDGAPRPGEVATLEPVQLNLADGHFLRVGIALQLTEGAHEIDGARALDATISLFSGRSSEELTTGRTRERLKQVLLQRLEKYYDHDVMDVYFTEFVMQ